MKHIIDALEEKYGIQLRERRVEGPLQEPYSTETN